MVDKKYCECRAVFNAPWETTKEEIEALLKDYEIINIRVADMLTTEKTITGKKFYHH